ncbi:MAG: PQQ-binding-like beta-propeller repeat protein [Vicinamibacterales bacterium]
MTAAVAAVVILFLAVLTPAPAAAQADAAKTDPLAALTALDQRWQRHLDEPASAPAGFDAARAFIPLKDGGIVALALDDGAVSWRRDLSTPFTPAAGDGLVFVVSGSEVQALDAVSGRTKWRAETGTAVAAPPYWDTGWLIISTMDGTLLAYRAADGVEVWRQGLGTPLAVRPAPALDRLYLGLTDGRLVSASLATGVTDWEYAVRGRMTGILGLDDQVVIGSTENFLISLDPRTGRERWRWRLGGDPAGAPSADDDRIYVAALDNVLRALDRRSGNLRWTRSLTARPGASPLRVGNLLLVPYVSAEIGVFDPEAGTPAFVIAAAGEVGARPYLRAGARPTAAQVFTLSRDGTIQGFAARFEPPPVALAELPGKKVEP